MTKDRVRKHEARARAQAMGEPYVVARRAGATGQPPPSDLWMPTEREGELPCWDLSLGMDNAPQCPGCGRRVLTFEWESWAGRTEGGTRIPPPETLPEEFNFRCATCSTSWGYVLLSVVADPISSRKSDRIADIDRQLTRLELVRTRLVDQRRWEQEHGLPDRPEVSGF